MKGVWVAAMVGWHSESEPQRAAPFALQSRKPSVRTCEMRLRIFEWHVFF